MFIWGGIALQDYIEDRVLRVAQHLIEHSATVRSAAAVFGISKSTVHKDMTERLKTINPSLYEQVSAVLLKNKAERHIRGGEATHRKYRGD